MKLTTQQEFELAMALLDATTKLGNVSDDQGTKTQCYQAGRVTCEAMNDFLKGKK